MDISKLSKERVKAAYKLFSKKEALERKVEGIKQEIANLFGVEKMDFSAAAPFNPVVPVVSRPVTSSKRPKGRVREEILAMLKAAGAAGVTASQIARQLGVKNQNVHVWFGTTGKKVGGFTKVAPGHWVLNEFLPASAVDAPEAQAPGE